MKKYNLPTFPIYKGMDIGYERDDDELFWLLNNGYFISSPITFYKKIVLDQGEFVLLSGSHEKYLAAHGEETLGRFSSLDKLLKSKRFGVQPLARWQWLGDDEGEVGK